MKSTLSYIGLVIASCINAAADSLTRGHSSAVLPHVLPGATTLSGVTGPDPATFTLFAAAGLFLVMIKHFRRD